MAEKKRKTQAEKAASASKSKKTTAAKSGQTAKTTGTQKSATVQNERQIPVRLITSLVFLGLFILLLVIYKNPEGAITRLISNILLGMVGQVGFLVAIPALLYLFIIHAFSGKRPVKKLPVTESLAENVEGGAEHETL